MIIMKTTKVKVRRKRKNPDKELRNTVELYLMVPPSPMILKRIRNKKSMKPPKKQ